MEGALTAARTIPPGRARSDDSRLESGRNGVGIAWQEFSGEKKTRSYPMGKGREVFDTELLRVVQALQAALERTVVDLLQSF